MADPWPWPGGEGGWNAGMYINLPRPHRIWNWNFGFPGHPHNWTWKHLLRIQLTSHRISLGHINSFTFQLTNSSFFHRNSSLFFINPSRFHTNSSLFHIFAKQILSLVQSNSSFFHIYIYIYIYVYLNKSFPFLYKFFTFPNFFHINSSLRWAWKTYFF